MWAVVLGGLGGFAAIGGLFLQWPASLSRQARLKRDLELLQLMPEELEGRKAFTATIEAQVSRLTTNRPAEPWWKDPDIVIALVAIPVGLGATLGAALAGGRNTSLILGFGVGLTLGAAERLVRRIRERQRALSPVGHDGSTS